MDSRREAKRAYKENPPPAGVYQIRNLRNQKIFIGSALNVRGKLNGILFTLQRHARLHEALQADWDQFGSEAFVFEILDELKPAAGETAVDPDELKALEEMWKEKLQPYGERGYNER